jgi:hypothetical protein
MLNVNSRIRRPGYGIEPRAKKSNPFSFFAQPPAALQVAFTQSGSWCAIETKRDILLNTLQSFARRAV